MTLSIDADRLWSRLMALGEDGARPEGGVNRQALSAEEFAAWGRVIGWGAEAGMTPATDAAGNLFLTLAGADPDAAPVLIGSHIDSQPTGGLFDGTFGTLAALEAATVIAEAGTVPARPIRVVAWMNEEGSRFAPGMMGSALFAGRRTEAATFAVRDADGVSVGEALAALHAAFADVPRLPLGFPVHAYVEPHIEQAEALEQAGDVIGVVTGIQGKVTFEVTVTGREQHAGTTPVGQRRDALQAFVRVAAGMQAAAMRVGEPVRFTIGRVEVTPNAPSVIPGRVVFRIDLRYPDNDTLGALAAELEAIAAREAEPCEVRTVRLVDEPSNGFDPDLMAAIERAAGRHGVPAQRLLSAAGHDARHIAPLAPSAMIFIPCRGGISHHPDEWAEKDHVAAGAAVLLDVVAEAAGVR
ncbi:hydantoinase/carbamoylase family amidase [Acuticoccus sediminis]|uniref:hydantoinase/carbamoylase family amidase n=1 Tax=Acuticoccus sediminis TaxID=2184697 RepID=UPI001CFCFF18|nr:hydantoinase/carbamoylase family amidase [Acuticoccus sediminis]